MARAYFDHSAACRLNSAPGNHAREVKRRPSRSVRLTRDIFQDGEEVDEKRADMNGTGKTFHCFVCEFDIVVLLGCSFITINHL